MGMCSGAVWAYAHVCGLAGAPGHAGAASPHDRRMTPFLSQVVVDTMALVTWKDSCNGRTFWMARSLATGDSDSVG